MFNQKFQRTRRLRSQDLLEDKGVGYMTVEELKSGLESVFRQVHVAEAYMQDQLENMAK